MSFAVTRTSRVSPPETGRFALDVETISDGPDVSATVMRSESVFSFVAPSAAVARMVS